MYKYIYIYVRINQENNLISKSTVYIYMKKFKNEQYLI